MLTKALCPRQTLLLSSLLLLTGCVTPGKNAIPPGGDMTMAQIYKQETGMTISPQKNEKHSRRKSTHQYVREQAGNQLLPQPDYVAYTATSKNEVDNLFQPLPNPGIPIYIYPHLVYSNGEAYPKPGLSTAFFLYSKNHFAMPDEAYRIRNER